jgi:glycosyltransferase involved in cell wall biosynthesis
MSTKTILIITDNTPDQINGVVTTFQNLEKHAAFDGYYISYIHPGMFPNISCPGYPEVKLAWAWGVGRRIEESNADYVHIATEGPLGLWANIWCWRKGLRFNTSYHTKFPEFLHSLWRIPTRWTYAYLRWFHNHSGRVLTTTSTMVKELYDHGFRGDIRPWTRGVDPAIFHPVHRMQSSAPRRKNLLCVSRLSKEKGLDDFCQLDIPNTDKILVGDGPYRAELEKKYPDVQFVGYRTGSDLAWFYSNADVFVFPSKTDTFGVVIIEALASGTPVAGYPVSGPVDIIQPGVDGIMHDDLTEAVTRCFNIDRDRVATSGARWTWSNCWNIFRDNLVDKAR